jgi:hypothetical protein
MDRIGKKYWYLVQIVVFNLIFFAVVPSLVSAASVASYLGLILCVLWPIAMYYLGKQLFKQFLNNSK